MPAGVLRKKHCDPSLRPEAARPQKLSGQVTPGGRLVSGSRKARDYSGSPPSPAPGHHPRPGGARSVTAWNRPPGSLGRGTRGEMAVQVLGHRVVQTLGHVRGVGLDGAAVGHAA